MGQMIKTFFGSLLFLFAAKAFAIPIGGVEFPDGAVSFADSVYSFTPGANVGPGYNNPLGALGTPDWSGANGTAVSLGIGGSLVLQFTDNSLTTSGDTDLDLWIFEIGAAVESMNVAISIDAISWVDLGNVSGQPSGIDIDAVAGVTAGAQYSFVRLNDVAPNQSGFPFGEADIDAVGAISSAAPVSVDEPPMIALLSACLFGLVGVRRTLKA